MGRFLFAVWPYAGHINPCMSLAERLRERGHKIAFCTGASVAPTVADEGYERFAFEALARYLGEVTGGNRDDDPALYRTLNCRYTTITETNPIEKLHRVQRLLLEMSAGSISSQVQDLTRIAKDWRPDVIVADAMMWAPMTVLHETIRLPVVPFSFYAGCLIPGSKIAPAGLGLPPSTGWASLSRNVFARGVMRALTGRVREKVNQIRKEMGLSALSTSVHAHSSRMPLYVVASTREFDYLRRDLPPSVEYAGPCLWESRRNHANNQALPLATSDETIYVSEGTAQVGAPFLIRPVIEALAAENVQVIATTGVQRSVETLGAPLSSNVVVRQWISQMGLFERTSVVISTGGSGTVRQALWFGIPILAAPLEWDQTENAQRLVNCGAGIRISLASCRADVIKPLVRMLQTDPSFRDNARRIGESFRLAAASNIALERMESLI